MKLYEKTMRLNKVDFKQIIGVKRETFAAMVEVLTVAASLILKLGFGFRGGLLYMILFKRLLIFGERVFL